MRNNTLDETCLDFFYIRENLQNPELTAFITGRFVCHDKQNWTRLQDVIRRTRTLYIPYKDVVFLPVRV